MANESATSTTTEAGWQTRQVYAMAAVCLFLGLALGYLFRGSGGQPGTPPAAQASTPANANAAAMQQMPTLDQMKHMADVKAEPLLAQLKSDPNNAQLLIQIGRVYESAHQFKEAADYYQKALQVTPKDVATRTQMASCLYYTGDVDGALAQLQQAVKDDPKNANSLFNLGFIRWKEKKDASGAIAAWQQLLKTNPTLQADKKAEVQKLIAEASQPRSMN